MPCQQFWLKIRLFCNEELSRTIFATAAAHSNFVSVGFTQGFSAIMLPQLDITAQQSSWIAGLGVLWTPVGALLSGILVDYIGRKPVLILPNIIFFFSWLLIGLDHSLSVLYLGRSLGGLAAGMVTSSYLYVCEISRTDYRGVLSAFGPVFVSIGILLVYTMGALFQWQVVAYIATIATIISNLLIIMIPESPSWYVAMNEEEKALKAMLWLRRDTKIARKEVLQLSEALNHRNQQKCQPKEQHRIFKKIISKLRDLRSSLTEPDVYKPFLIILLFFFFQEGSGIYIFLFYSVQVFQEFGTNYDENVITITIGVLRLIMAIFGAVLMLKFGRRQLSIYSGGAMSISLLVVSLYLIFIPFMHNPLHILPVMCIFLHVGFSMTGFLQIPFILSSELFPVRCRGLMGGITCSLGYVLIFISVKIYPALLQLIHIEGILWICFILTSVGVVFLALFLPETKDKSFEEIAICFMKKPNANKAIC